MSSGTNKQRLDQNNAKIEQLTQALNNKVIENIGFPIEVSTSSAMDALLVSANVGKVYKFTGTTDANYTNGDLYIVESFNSGYAFKKFIQTYNIANILSNCSTNNADTYIQSGQAYSATLSASTGYTLTGGTISVTMDNVDITSTAYNNGVISIAEVTGNIVISVTAVVIVYSITNSLSNCTSSNNAQTIQYGSSYSATITANTDYTLTGASVSITMGGTDITSTAYSNGTISIASVTGDLDITISAVSDQPVPVQENFITFSSPSSFTLGSDYPEDGRKFDGVTEYSTDKTNWTSWDFTQPIQSALVNGNYVIYMRGIGNTGNGSGMAFITNITNDGITVSGNIENLLDYATVAQGNHPPMAANCFYALFFQTDVIDCSNLILGAITATQSCYEDMFRCPSLIYAPQIKLETTAQYCCKWMFYECSELITIPKLLPLDLKKDCCLSMFNGCSKIKISQTQDSEYINEYRIPYSGTGTALTNSLGNMFANTGGSFTGTPSINRTYYTSNQVV